jgi:hypothetical protein
VRALAELGEPVEVFAAWATEHTSTGGGRGQRGGGAGGDGRGRLRMEDFHRWARRRHGVLMDGDEPAGGVWNTDKDNREPPPSGASTLDVRSRGTPFAAGYWAALARYEPRLRGNHRMRPTLAMLHRLADVDEVVAADPATRAPHRPDRPNPAPTARPAPGQPAGWMAV